MSYRDNNHQHRSSSGDSASEYQILTQEDTIYVSGLSPEVTVDNLAELFGSIGVIKIDRKKKPNEKKIFLYMDKDTGKPKGDATLTYDDPEAAKAAINWYNNFDFMGSKIKVELAQRKVSNEMLARMRGRGGGRGGYGGRGDSRGRGSNEKEGGYGGGGYGGGYDGSSEDGSGGGGGYEGNEGGRGYGGGRGGGGGGGFEQREGDWTCPNPSCGNVNWARRMACNKCHTPKPGGSGGSGGGSRGEGGGYGERSGGGSRRHHSSSEDYSGGQDTRDRSGYHKQPSAYSSGRRDNRDRPY